jgi:hypothetical protein
MSLARIPIFLFGLAFLLNTKGNGQARTDTPASQTKQQDPRLASKPNPSRYPRELKRGTPSTPTESGGIRAMLEKRCSALGLTVDNNRCSGRIATPVSVPTVTVEDDSWAVVLSKICEDSTGPSG